MRRIRANFILVAALVLLVGCAGCRNSNQVYTDFGKEEPIGESASANGNLTDNGVKAILNQLIPKAESVYGMFNGSGWFEEDTTKTIPGEEEYSLVTGGKWETALDTSDVNSIADLKKVVESVFTKDTAQKLFFSRYLDTKDIGLPLYKDYKGQLYVNTTNGGHGWATKFLMDTVKIKSQNKRVIEIALDTTVLDDPYGTLIIKIEFADGKWLMASGLDDYESKRL